jgi:uncharacterized Zn-binding protein involved in type VI secretion
MGAGQSTEASVNMQIRYVELQVGDTIRVGDRLITVVKVTDGEAQFRVERLPHVNESDVVELSAGCTLSDRGDLGSLPR